MISVTETQMRRVNELAVGSYWIALEEMMELAGTHLARLAASSSMASLGNRASSSWGRATTGEGAPSLRGTWPIEERTSLL